MEMGRGRGRARGRGRDPINPNEGGGYGQDNIQAVGRASGRARGRGRDPINPDEDGGQVQDQIQAVGRATGRAAEENSATSPKEVIVPDKAVTGNSSPPKPGPRHPLMNEGTENAKKADEENEEKKAYPPSGGFLDPLDINLPYLSDTIRAGEERYCAVYTMESTSALYLILSKHFSKAVDGYIKEMGLWYENKVPQEVKKLHLNVREEGLVPGAIVVVHHKDKDQKEAKKEWKRAKIVERHQHPGGQMYKVLFLDLGDFGIVHSRRIFCMHESFKEKPVFAIKARLELVSPLNDKSDRAVCERILEVVQNRKVLVKFIKKEGDMNEKYWIVSLLSMKRRPGIEDTYGFSQSIEQQVIGEIMDNQEIQ